MLRTSSRLHTITYAILLAVVLICASIHLAAFLSDRFNTTLTTNPVFLPALVAFILAPPSSLMMALYSSRMISIQESLHELATTDPLTELHNRRAFEFFYEREAARFRRTEQPMYLLLFDLDHFKAVNDAYGHSGGDKTLKHIAKILKANRRFGTDELARWGGEEFLLLLTNTDRKAALQAAERFRSEIEAMSVEFGLEAIRTTVSIGLIACRRNEDLEDAVRRADKYLHTAKQAGRNCIVAERQLQRATTQLAVA